MNKVQLESSALTPGKINISGLRRTGMCVVKIARTAGRRVSTVQWVLAETARRSAPGVAWVKNTAPPPTLSTRL